jgi:hypothetical protein
MIVTAQNSELTLNSFAHENFANKWITLSNLIDIDSSSSTGTFEFRVATDYQW